MQEHHRTEPGQDQSVDSRISFRLAEKLLVEKTLDLKSITGILGQRPFPMDEHFKEYISVMEVLSQLILRKLKLNDSS